MLACGEVNQFTSLCLEFFIYESPGLLYESDELCLHKCPTTSTSLHYSILWPFGVLMRLTEGSSLSNRQILPV